jgi:hypothetical protein
LPEGGTTPEGETIDEMRWSEGFERIDDCGNGKRPWSATMERMNDDTSDEGMSGDCERREIGEDQED